MAIGDPVDPVAYNAVMVSSTFTDLQEHRAAVSRAVEAAGLHQLSMELDTARVGDVVDSSLQKVRDAAAYVGIIGHSYGQIPDDESNPSRLSLTQLEFQEARRLGRPIIIFIMSDRHPVTLGSTEHKKSRLKKLQTFREEVKRVGVDAGPMRLYKEFDSVHDLEIHAERSMAELRRHLDLESESAERASRDLAAEQDGIPALPGLYAEPRYIGSHGFVGRADQLAALDVWARSDENAVFLFEAIGGAGKSILTWEWTSRRVVHARPDFAGRFWYSFYEKGADMADFCARALAYMTRRPVKSYGGKKTTELTERLLQELAAQP